MHYQSRVLVKSNPLVFPLSSTTLSFETPVGVAPPPPPLHWRRWRNTENGWELSVWQWPPPKWIHVGRSEIRVLCIYCGRSDDVAHPANGRRHVEGPAVPKYAYLWDFILGPCFEAPVWISSGLGSDVKLEGFFRLTWTGVGICHTTEPIRGGRVPFEPLLC